MTYETLREHAEAEVPVVDAMTESSRVLERAMRIKVDRDYARDFLHLVDKGDDPVEVAAFILQHAGEEAQRLATTVVRSSDSFAAVRHACHLAAVAEFNDPLMSGSPVARILRKITEAD